MSESLIIEGKQYISAHRAAEIAGYSNDYVGQLCRSGKVVSRMVGRFWYVNEKSLRKHKKESTKANQTSFGSTDLKPKKSASPDAPNQPVSANVTISFDLVSLLKQIFFVILIVAVIAGGIVAISVGRPVSLGNNTANAYSAINSVSGVLSSAFDRAYSSISSIFFPSRQSGQSLSMVSSSSSESDQDSNDNATTAHAGLVVVPRPSQSSDATNEKLTQSITNTFSDDIAIKPGPNGTTGVITPEFRTVKGHDFLYVLVPVKTSSSTPAADATSTVSGATTQ